MKGLLQNSKRLIRSGQRLFVGLLFFSGCIGLLPKTTAATSSTVTVTSGSLSVTNLAQSGTILTVAAGGSFASGITLATGTVTGGTLSLTSLIFSGTSSFQDKDVNLSVLSNLQLAAGGSLTVPNGMSISYGPSSGILLGGSSAVINVGSSATQGGILGATGGEIRVDSVFASRGTLTVNTGTATADTVSAAYLDLGAKLDLVKNGRGLLGLNGLYSPANGGSLSVFSGTATVTAGTLLLGDNFLSDGTSNSLKIIPATSSTSFPVVVALQGYASLSSLLTSGGSATNVILGVSTDATSGQLVINNAATDNSIFKGVLADAVDGTEGFQMFVTKNGEGSLLLSNVNSSFTGGFTLNAGSLIVNASSQSDTDANGITKILGPLGGRALNLRGGTLFAKPPFDIDGQLTTSVLLHNAVSFFAFTDPDVAEGGSLILQRKATFASANGTDTLTFAGVMDLDSNANVTAGGSVTLVVNTPTEISGAITGDPYYGGLTGGSMSLVKSGSAQLTLSGGNQYLGNFTVSQGTLLLGSAGALGINDPDLGAFSMNSLTVSSGGVLDLGGFTSSTSTPLILSGTGAGGGALTNSGVDASTYSGSLTLATASGIGGAGDIILSGSVASAYNLTKIGVNTLTFGGTSMFSGSLQASAGITTISSTGTFEFTSTGGLVGNLTNEGVLRFNNSADRTVAGTISGTGSLVKVGASNLTLPGSTYTGATTISSGSLTVKGALSTSQISNSGTFNWSPTNSVFTGSLSGSGKTILTSTSTVTLTLGTLGYTPTFDGNIQVGSNVTLAVNAGARLSGSIEVLSGGAVSLASSVGSVFGSTTKLTVNGGVVDLKGNTVSVGSLTLLNGGTFISSSGTAKITFSGGTLSVAPSSLVITSQPQSQTVVAGSSALFSVSASGTGPLSFQWKKDGSTILTGGTSSTYTIPAATTANAGSYSVVVTNSSGSVSSGSATLTVNTPVSITSQPASVTVTSGSSASFSVTATGTAPLTYQWKKDGTSITGGTSSTYTIPAATATNAGTYSVVVTNLLGSVSSTNASLSINTPVSITGQPASATVTAGSSTSFSVTATGTGPISYQWKKGNALINGGTSATYTIASAVDADAGVYSVLVSNLLGSISSGSATLTVNTPVSITSQPASVTVTSGSSASFSVTATGTAPLTYQWKKDGTSITGGTSSTYTIPAATATNAGTYSVVVTNLLGSVSSASATLSINTPVSITGQPASATVTAGSSTSFSVTATGTGPISYQWKKGNALINGGTSATYTIASAVDADAGVYSVLVSNLLGSVSSGSATLTVNTPVSITSQPASVTVTSGSSASFSVTATGTAPLTYQWKKDGSSITGGTSSTYTIPAATATNAGTYSVVVTNLLGSVSSASATLSINTPVSITGQPISATVTAGSSATFSVTATGTGPISYQWKKGNALINGGTSATYTIASAVDADAGVYSVLVSNLLGSVSSGSATLTVNTPVSITSQPASVTVTSGSSASFSVTATGTAPLTYQWKKNGSIILTGGTSSTYTIPAATAVNAGTYSVVVTNFLGSVSSGSATLTVKMPINISKQPSSLTMVAKTAATLRVAVDQTGASAPIDFEIFSITSGTLGASTGIKGTVPSSGTLDISLKDLVTGGSYTTKFTTLYNGSTYVQDSDQFNVTLRTWDDAVGTYSTTMNTDPSSPDTDEATYRGVLNVTVSRTGTVSGKLIYTEAAYSLDGSLREYRPVTRSFTGALTANAQDPTKLTVTPKLGTTSVASHQSLTITLDFACADTANADGTPGPVALIASLVDTYSGGGGTESAWLSSSDPHPIVRGITKLPSSLSLLQGKYSVVSDDQGLGDSVFTDTHAYSLIQVLSSGKLLWTTRTPGYLGTGSAILNGFDLTTLVAPFYETRSATSYRQSLYGWLSFAQDENATWKAAIGSGDAGAKLEKLYYCKNAALDGGIQNGVVFLAFNDANGCRWAGSAAPSIPSYLTASTISMSLNDTNPDLGLVYNWIPTFSATGTAALIPPTSDTTPKPSALQFKLYKATGELKGSFIGSDKKRRNILGVAFGLDVAARGWVETGTFPILQLSDWSINN